MRAGRQRLYDCQSLRPYRSQACSAALRLFSFFSSPPILSGKSVEEPAETQVGVLDGESDQVSKASESAKRDRRNEAAVHGGVTEQTPGAELELGELGGRRKKLLALGVYQDAEYFEAQSALKVRLRWVDGQDEASEQDAYVFLRIHRLRGSLWVVIVSG